MIWTFNVFLAFWFFVFLHQFSTCHTCPLSLGDLCLLKAQTLNTSSYSGVCSMRQAWCSSCREVCVWLITCVLSGCRSFLSPSPSLPTVHYSENERERDLLVSLLGLYMTVSLSVSLSTGNEVWPWGQRSPSALCALLCPMRATCTTYTQ